jgi:hypothetical protein
VEWFRTYHAILDKPRFARLSAEAVGYWTLFACAASRSSPRGSLPDDAEELALVIHRPAAAVAAMTETLLEVGLLERRPDGQIWMRKWEAYQPPSTERAGKSKQKATRGNKSQHAATNGIPRGELEEKRLEEKYPPKPPRRGGRKKVRPQLTPEQQSRLMEDGDGDE